MPNSKIYEKGTVLPSGGTAQSFLNPSLPRMKGVSDVVSDGLGVPVERPNFWKSPNVSQFHLSADAESMGAARMVSDNKGYVNKGDATGSVMDYILAGQNDEARYNRDNESKKRLLLLTDALRHMGNLYFTTKGAYPQNLSSSVVGQEERYQTEKAQRQKDRSLVVQQALSAAKQRADEEYKNGLLGQKQAELDRKQALDALNFNLNLQKQKDLNDYRKRQGDLAAERMDETKRHNKASEANSRATNALGWANYGLRAQKEKTKDKIEIRSYKDDETMTIGKDKLNDATFKSDTRKTYNELVRKNAIPPIKGRRWDSTSQTWVEYDKPNPSTNEMIEAMQEGSWSYPYMSWANKYADNPMEIINKPTIKHIKFQKRIPRQGKDQKNTPVNKSGKGTKEEALGYKRK